MACFRKSLRKQIKTNAAYGIMDLKWRCPSYIYNRSVFRVNISNYVFHSVNINFSTIFIISVIPIQISNYKWTKRCKSENGSLALIASLYSIWLIYAAGLKNLLLVSIVYGIGIIVYVYARKRKSLFYSYRDM